MTVAAASIDEFRRCVMARDARGAVDVAVGLADDGVPVVDIITELVVPVQVDIGEQWHHNRVSVADEHAASAIADAVVSVLAAYGPTTASAGDRGGLSVAVVCAEGEWHLLAARVIAEVLRAAGCRVAFLGGSMPADHLARFLAASPPDVVAISCSTALGLVGAFTDTRVAHDAGVPVLVGGRAFGRDDHRARAIGADLWAPDASAAVAALRALDVPGRATLARPSGDVEAARHVGADRERIVSRAAAVLADLSAAYRAFTDDQHTRVHEDLAYLVRFGEAAILTDDPRLFDEFVDWLAVLVCSRELPPETVRHALQAVAAAAVDHPALCRLLARAPATAR